MQQSRGSSASQGSEGSIASRTGSCVYQAAFVGAESGYGAVPSMPYPWRHHEETVFCAVCERSCSTKWNLARHVFGRKHTEWTEEEYNAIVEARRRFEEEKQKTTGIRSTRWYPFLNAERHKVQKLQDSDRTVPQRPGALTTSTRQEADIEGMAQQGPVIIHQPIPRWPFSLPREETNMVIPQGPPASTISVHQEAFVASMAQQGPHVIHSPIPRRVFGFPSDAMRMLNEFVDMMEAGSLPPELSWNNTLTGRPLQNLTMDHHSDVVPSTSRLFHGSAPEPANSRAFPDCPPSPCYAVGDDLQGFNNQDFDPIMHAFACADTEIDTACAASQDVAADPECPYTMLRAFLSECADGNSGVVSGWL